MVNGSGDNGDGDDGHDDDYCACICTVHLREFVYKKKCCGICTTSYTFAPYNNRRILNRAYCDIIRTFRRTCMHSYRVNSNWIVVSLLKTNSGWIVSLCAPPNQWRALIIQSCCIVQNDCSHIETEAGSKPWAFTPPLFAHTEIKNRHATMVHHSKNRRARTFGFHSKQFRNARLLVYVVCLTVGRILHTNQSRPIRYSMTNTHVHISVCIAFMSLQSGHSCAHSTCIKHFFCCLFVCHTVHVPSLYVWRKLFQYSVRSNSIIRSSTYSHICIMAIHTWILSECVYVCTFVYEKNLEGYQNSSEKHSAV